jgi:hypothetical protein
VYYDRVLLLLSTPYSVTLTPFSKVEICQIFTNQIFNNEYQIKGVLTLSLRRELEQRGAQWKTPPLQSLQIRHMLTFNYESSSSWLLFFLPILTNSILFMQANKDFTDYTHQKPFNYFFTRIF